VSRPASWRRRRLAQFPLDVTVPSDRVTVRAPRGALCSPSYAGRFFFSVTFCYTLVLALLVFHVIIVLRSCDRVFLEVVIMAFTFTAAEKALLIGACETEQKRMARAINANPNQSIKEIMFADLRALQAVQSRVANEVVK